MGTADILASVQAAADILTDDATYIADLIERAKRFLKQTCQLVEFPLHSQGTSVSGASATEDISGLSAATFGISLHGSPFFEVTLTLANCDSGANTAAEMQTQIRAVDTGGTSDNFVWDNVTVAFATTKYTITDVTFGADSEVNVSFEADEYHVAQATKLGPTFGGIETRGTERSLDLEQVCAQMVIDAYRRIHLSAGDYEDAASRDAVLKEAFRTMDADTRKLALANRRIAI